MVIDSLGSTSDLTDAKENEAGYAQPLYEISQRCGDESREDGFPAAAILWIHHNTKDDGGFRGTDRLNNAVDETWSLKALDEEQEAEFGTHSRLLTIGKSRYERSGDRLLVTRDLDLNYEIKDLTPTLTRAGVGRNGALEPLGVVLEVLRAADGPLTRAEVREGVKQYMQGEGADKFPKETAIRKYLTCWITDGLVAVEEEKCSGVRGGRPIKRYSLMSVERERNNDFIDLDDQNSWPQHVFEFLRGPVRIAHKPLLVSAAQKPPEGVEGHPPENVGGFCAGGFLRADIEVRAGTSSPVATTDLKDAGSFCAKSLPVCQGSGLSELPPEDGGSTDRGGGSTAEAPEDVEGPTAEADADVGGSGDSWDDAFGSLDQYDL